MMKKLLTILTVGILLSITACDNEGTSDDSSESNSENGAIVNESLPTVDRAGNAIDVPENIETIVSLAPAITQVIEDLDALDRLVAVDTFSIFSVAGLDDLLQFDMMLIDLEQLLLLNPDVIFASEISFGMDADIFAPLIDAGVLVVKIPTSNSIDAIAEDVQFIADVLGLHAQGHALASEMQARIAEIRAIGATIAEPRTVLFEISPSPYIFSFGSGVFLNEMIEIVGAQNILANEIGWLPVSEEIVVYNNPDVILTNVSFLDDPVQEILIRDAWQGISAVANGDVHQITEDFTSLPNHRIIEGLGEMARAIYPEYFE